MSVYEGLHNEQGFQVHQDGRPLKLHYTRSRDWRTEAGLRQLALDILIAHLAECYAQPATTESDLQLKDARVAAWLPHLHYAPALTSILWTNGDLYEVPDLSAGGQNHSAAHTNHIRPRHGTWTLQADQVALWLDDWMYDRHCEFLARRKPSAVGAWRYAQWEGLLKEQLGTTNFDDIGMPLAWRFRTYLTGFSPKALTTSWNTAG